MKVLVSGASYFNDKYAINAYYNELSSVNTQNAIKDHSAIVGALMAAGIEAIKAPAPEGCQDGVYTANWGLVRDKKAILSSLPNKRKAEEPHARNVLQSLGFQVITPPHRFSGQGDALACGDLLFAGSGYRSDERMHNFIQDKLGYKVISLQTVPLYDGTMRPITNVITGWPDSFFYDIDLALSVINDDLIAWCPEAFLPTSQELMRNLPIEKIDVSLDEAVSGFACNLISTGETVIMSDSAPLLRADIESRGIRVITPHVTELGKGGGYIRCCALTIC